MAAQHQVFAFIELLEEVLDLVERVGFDTYIELARRDRGNPRSGILDRLWSAVVDLHVDERVVEASAEAPPPRELAEVVDELGDSRVVDVFIGRHTHGWISEDRSPQKTSGDLLHRLRAGTSNREQAVDISGQQTAHESSVGDASDHGLGSARQPQRTERQSAVEARKQMAKCQRSVVTDNQPRKLRNDRLQRVVSTGVVGRVRDPPIADTRHQRLELSGI